MFDELDGDAASGFTFARKVRDVAVDDIVLLGEQRSVCRVTATAQSTYAKKLVATDLESGESCTLVFEKEELILSPFCVVKQLQVTHLAADGSLAYFDPTDGCNKDDIVLGPKAASSLPKTGDLSLTLLQAMGRDFVVGFRIEN